MKVFTRKLIMGFLLVLALENPCRAQSFTPSQDVLSQALSYRLVQWKPDSLVGNEYIAYNAFVSARAMNYLALAAYHNPTNTLVINRLLQHIRKVIAGGNEPTCRGTIAGWADNALAQSLTLAKFTPDVWDELSATEKTRCDWLMKALTVAGNYNQNYQNAPVRCMLGTFPYGGKRNAPNIQEGYVGIMIAAHKYFGGTANVNAILAGFDYDTYLAAFTSLGYTNIIFGWTFAYGDTPTGRAQMEHLMEQGDTPVGGGTITSVRIPFTFGDYNSPAVEVPYDPLLVYQALADRMYRHEATNRSETNQAYILSNRVTPMQGLMGMCAEFQFTDGGGERSSARYAYDGWSNSIMTYATLRSLGLWGTTAAHKEIDRRLKVGSIDLLYKYKAGYYGRSNGNFYTYTETSGTELGYIFLKDIWTNLLWDRPEPSVFELVAPTVRESFNAVTLGSSYANGQFTGENGVIWHFTQARRQGTERVKPSDANVMALAPNTSSSGNIRTSLTRPLKALRFKVRARTTSGTPGLTVRINGTAIRTYSNFAQTEVEVLTLSGLSALTGNVIMIENTGTTELLLDDLELEEASVYVLLKNGNTGSPTTSQIKPRFQLNNITASAIPYSQLRFRYWFTSENPATLETFVDLASMGLDQVNMVYTSLAGSPRQGADGYMEYSFKTTAGNLPANGNSGSLNTRIRKVNQTNFNEADDYSYVSSANFVQTNKVTVYRDVAGGQPQLIWGKEPALIGSLRTGALQEEYQHPPTEDIALYPNPADQQVFVKGLNSGGLVDVTISAINGQVLHRGCTDGKTPIQVGNLASGLYIVRLGYDGGMIDMKLVKK